MITGDLEWLVHVSRSVLAQDAIPNNRFQHVAFAGKDGVRESTKHIGADYTAPIRIANDCQRLTQVKDVDYCRWEGSPEDAFPVLGVT